MTSEAYVFIDGLEDSPIICGFFKLNPQTGRGEFNYGKSYLARSDAFAPLVANANANAIANAT